MKNTSVKDILTLPIMANYRLVAGKNGLGNSINYVTVYDTTPTKTDPSIPLYENDAYITSFYFGRNDDNFIMDFLRNMYNAKASVVICIDEFIETLPDSALKFCDEHSLPIVFIPKTTPYSQIISGIMEYKFVVELLGSVEKKLEILTNSDISQNRKNEIIEDLNPHFQKTVLCFYCLEKDYLKQKDEHRSDYINIINYIKRSLTRFAAEYKSGLLVIVSYQSASNFELEKLTDETLGILQRYLPKAIIGISNPCLLSELGSAISQSFIAAHSGYFDEKQVSYFNSLGVSRLLFAFKGSSVLDGFYHDIIDPILKYDAKYSGQFFDTMKVFLENDMDYKRTSKALFIHENTVRYRINKIKELIPYGKNDMDFNITIAVAWKLHPLMLSDEAE